MHDDGRPQFIETEVPPASWAVGAASPNTMAALRAAEMELNGALERLENRATHMSEALIERFDPVLLPPSPSTAKLAAESLSVPREPQPVSPLGETLLRWTGRINEAVDRLERVEGEMLNRVDL